MNTDGTPLYTSFEEFKTLAEQWQNPPKRLVDHERIAKYEKQIALEKQWRREAEKRKLQQKLLFVTFVVFLLAWLPLLYFKNRRTQ